MFPPVDPSRRGFLAQAAIVAAGGAALGMALPLPVSAGNSQRVPDPILAAIEAHKVAAATSLAAVKRNSVFEDELYAHERLQTERRLEDEHARQEEIDAAIEEAHHAEQVEAYALLDVTPTTMEGVIALLTYACDHDDANDAMGWPEAIGLADEPGSRSWQYFLIQNLTVLLPKLVPVSA
jgi:hypothetical protein